MRVHINHLPQVVLVTQIRGIEIGQRVKSVPKLSLEDDDIVYDSIERPNLQISNSRAVFFHAFTQGLNLYETTGSDEDIVIYNPLNPIESSQWKKQIFYATAEQGFALYKSRDALTSKLTYFRPYARAKKRDDSDGDVWLDIHVKFSAGPGQTVIGQRRRVNKNTGEIEYGQTFVQPLDVALDSYAELGRAIEEVLNPQPDPEKIVSLHLREDRP
ncbi:MAG: hypothetical protein AAFR82_01975 [Pseudomonadota bacterium]